MEAIVFIVAPRNVMFLIQIFRFEGKYASFKNIKFPRGKYQTDSFETWTFYDFVAHR